MFISKLRCPERKEHNTLTSKCRFKTPKIHELCYVMEFKTVRVPFLFPLSLVDLDKEYRNEIEMGKK